MQHTYHIPSHIFEINNDDIQFSINTMNTNDKLIQYIKSSFVNIKDNDIIHFESAGNYMDDGKIIWNNNKLRSYFTRDSDEEIMPGYL
jgi:hypothetical protein